MRTSYRSLPISRLLSPNTLCSYHSEVDDYYDDNKVEKDDDNNNDDDKGDTDNDACDDDEDEGLSVSTNR